MNKRNVYIIITVAFCVFNALTVDGADNCFSGEDIIILFSFGSFEINSASIMELFKNMVPFVTFSLIAGTGIYRYLCDAGVYCFYRTQNRNKWIIREMLKLFLETILYSGTYYCAAFVCMCAFCKTEIASSCVPLLLKTIILFALWLFLVCLLINLISLKLSTIPAVSIITGIQFLLISVFALCGHDGIFDIYDEKKRETGIKILKCNPFSRLIISWYGGISGNNIYATDTAGLGLKFSETFIFQAAALFTVFAAMMLIVSKMELYGDLQE